MKKTISANLSHAETVWGWGYLVFQIVLLPSLLHAVNGMLPRPLSSAELNFTFFLLNFLAMLWIFHGFLGRSAAQVRQHPIYFLQAVILGTVAYFACSYGVDWVISQLAPNFRNANDDAIASLSQGGYFLTAVGTVILVPPVEECLYRGLIFRKLYSKSRWAAYGLSILAFALIHIVGYIGAYTPLELTLCVLQYVPAGLCLAWAYAKSDTIFAPILIHALVNAVGIAKLR